MDGSKLLYDPYFELLSFLITSARGLLEEPVIYGSLRLVEAARKLLDLMEDRGIADERVNELKKYIDENIDTVLYGEEEFKKFLEGLVKRLSSIIKEELRHD